MLKLDGTVRPWEKEYPPHLRGFDPQNNGCRLVSDILANAVLEHGDRIAFAITLQSGDIIEKTYREIDEYSDAIAAYLRFELRLQPGDVIAIQLPNSLHYPIILFGAFKAGLTVTNINPLYTPREIAFQLEDSRAKVLFGFAIFADRIGPAVNGRNLKKVIIASPWEFFPLLTKIKIKLFLTKIKKIVPPASFACESFDKVLSLGKQKAKQRFDLSGISPKSAAMIQYTGGTTGVSKGAVITHQNILSVLTMVLECGDGYLKKDDQNTVLTILPLYHIFAMIMNLMIYVSIGGKNVLIPNPQPLSNLKHALEIYDIDWVTGVDTLFAGLMAEPWFMESAPKIRLAISGGTALRLDTEARWQENIGTIVEGYGLTETTCVVCFNPVDGSARSGSVGIPMPGIDIRIIDEDGKPVGFDKPGELYVKGANVVTAYLNREEESEEAFVDGWMATGDIVTMDEDGFVRIVDRKKDMILASGFNVFPNELENIISMLDGVGDVAVIGVQHDKRGEAPKAFIVRTNSTITKDDILTHCRENLAAYKIPVEVEFRDELPKSPVGKILRKLLRGQ